MKDRAFIDTNILVYLYSAGEQRKRDACIDALDRYTRVTSIQVLNELSNVFVKKFKMDIDSISHHLDNIGALCSITQIDRSIINKALTLHKRYKYSYFDCLILASALSHNCSVVLTEDMNDGQVIEGSLTIVNPAK